MFLNRSNNVRSPNKTLGVVHLPYSMLIPNGYQLPKKMLNSIEKEVEQITIDSIMYNLIDEFTLEEMQNENVHFINKIIQHMFVKPLNELKRQKIMEREIISSIYMLQRAELYKQKRALEFAKKELEKCNYMLGLENSSELNISR